VAATEALVQRKRVERAGRAGRRAACLISILAWQRVVLDFEFDVAAVSGPGTGACAGAAATAATAGAVGTAGFLAEESLGVLESEVARLKKAAVGRAEELAPAAEDTRATLWDHLVRPARHCSTY
jgi:hypothetical protein